MNSLFWRRVFVWVVSQVIGFIITALFVVGVLHLLVPDFDSVSIEKYGYIYFLVTAVPIGLTVMFWMDYFMDTRILPD
jgi:hypothetical protein